MRTCLVLTALAAVLISLPGCGACPKPGWANCNQSWDFYDPCDLIEGRNERCCENECVRPCDPGFAYTRDNCAKPVGTEEPGGEVVIEEEIVEGSPAVGEVVETNTSYSSPPGFPPPAVREGPPVAPTR